MTNSEIEIKRIQIEDIVDLSTVLTETVKWLGLEDISQWPLDEISPEKLLETYGNDEIYIGYLNNQPVCSVIIQETDDVFWQGANHEDALYLHKLAVTSPYRGSGLAETLVDLVCQRSLELGKYFVRLDCRTNREKLCNLYIQLGFQHHGDIIYHNSSSSLFQKTL